MKRIAILVVLVLVIATSLALTASIATAQPGRDCPEDQRPRAEPRFKGQTDPPVFSCVPTGPRR